MSATTINHGLLTYVENSFYKRYDNIISNNTYNISKAINQYTTDVVNNYKINKASNLKKTLHFIDDAVVNKHNAIYINDNINVTK